MNLSTVPTPDAAILKKVLGMLSVLEGIQVRPVFGEWGLFRNSVMFGWVSNGKCYLRGCQNFNTWAQGKNLPTLSCLHRHGRKMTIRYYCIDDALFERREQLLEYILISIQSVKRERESAAQGKKSRILEAAERHLKVPTGPVLPGDWDTPLAAPPDSRKGSCRLEGLRPPPRL